MTDEHDAPAKLSIGKFRVRGDDRQCETGSRTVEATVSFDGGGAGRVSDFSERIDPGW
ncbi:MAG: hypothetical protein WB607_31035 [Candidatus Acidiferrum sp.]|jgi:hypothetical protein